VDADQDRTVNAEHEEAYMSTLTGKVAIVTGGTSGIGERIIERFVEEGAEVVVSARRQEEGQALEKRLGVRFVGADVASEPDVKAMVDRAIAAFGRIDCLVANAGVPSPMISITEIDVATIDHLLAINVRGVLLCIKHVAPVMLAQGSGSIITIGSIAGLRGVSGHIYSASKGAVQALTRSVASELGEKGIRVNCISPGAIVTGIVAKSVGVTGPDVDRAANAAKDLYAGMQPIPRAGMPEDIAQAAVFLAGDGSGFVNGHDFVVDGGFTITKGWSRAIAGRAEMAKRIKAAVATP
jgi:NAD(P)-dependent dehydrogenase (short-subunit alcohol dehydrogenase family)